MDEKTLKDMWKNMDLIMDNPGYSTTDIEGFLKGKSQMISKKISEIIRTDLVIKYISAIFLLLDFGLYSSVQPVIGNISLIGLLLIIPLIVYQTRLFRTFNAINDKAANVKEKLTSMLSFLNLRSFDTLLSVSSTYLFGYSGGMLLYFFFTYGQLRRIGGLDIFVFPSICIMGMVFTYIFNKKRMDFQKKHIQLCLSDIDEDAKKMIDMNLETKQKTDKLITLLVGIVVLFAFLIFVFILKKMGL